MKLTLLGTGGADGWPNPFCTCPSCAGMRSRGEVRGQTSVLIDGVLLLDCGPEVPRAAERLGRSLAGLRHVLITHAHPDHTGPAALMWRSWAGRPEPLDLAGPSAVLAACADWIGPDDPVRRHEVRAGDRLVLGAYEIRVLAAAHADVSIGPAVLYDVTGSDGGRVLYATDTGPLPPETLDAVSDAAYDVVLLEETFGDLTGQGTDHLDLPSFAETLAELRRRGAVLETTRVVPVHLGHRNPPTDELDRRLAAWGAELLPDGAELEARVERARPVTRSSDPATPARPAIQSSGPATRPTDSGAQRVLILGGARSGKSAAAERRLAAEPAVTYVATAPAHPDDPEWAARLAGHRARRPAAWRTVETTDLETVLHEGTGPVLIDDLGLWLTAALDAGDWNNAAAAGPVDSLIEAWRGTSTYVVAVSNEVGSGVVPATPSGRRFRDELGRLNARLAAESDEVWLMTAGVAQRLR